MAWGGVVAFACSVHGPCKAVCTALPAAAIGMICAACKWIRLSDYGFCCLLANTQLLYQSTFKWLAKGPDPCARPPHRVSVFVNCRDESMPNKIVLHQSPLIVGKCDKGVSYSECACTASMWHPFYPHVTQDRPHHYVLKLLTSSLLPLPYIALRLTASSPKQAHPLCWLTPQR